jgi:DNA-binding NtrC family response regulator
MRIDRQQAFSGTTSSDIDAAALEPYLSRVLPGFAGPITLVRFKGHRQKTAHALGIGVRTLGLKLKKWKQTGLVAENL